MPASLSPMPWPSPFPKHRVTFWQASQVLQRQYRLNR